MNEKIAIMTWHMYNNYGGVLQAYSLRKKILEFGYQNVDFVNYTPTPKTISLREKFQFQNIYEFFNSKFSNQKLENLRNKKFDEFRNEKFTYTKLCDNRMKLYSLNNEYDKFVCGSDQIWAPTLFDENYFLKFVNNSDKKIAYAPSIGLAEISDDVVEKQMKSLILDFDALSVREEKGREIIKNLTNKDAKVVLDPTLLLNKDEWNVEFELCNYSIKNYVLVYCLGDISKAYKIAKKLNKKIIVIPKNYADYNKYKRDVIIPSPIEFLKLIYNADMVITDSFHGMIFSMNFNTPFIVLKRFKDNSLSQNSRIYNMLKIAELENRLYNDNLDYFINNTYIDFKRFNEIIVQKRMESLNFLKNALSKENIIENEKKIITNACTGCGVCVAVCPQKCLDIKYNEYGFLEYVKDEDRCTHCGLCKKVCAQLKSSNVTLIDKKLFSFYSYDKNVLAKSSSGGFAYEISKMGLENGYKIVGCTYDYTTNSAKHIVVNNLKELDKLSGSKYLQSYTKEAFEDILKLDKAIVIGTPCQIAALNNLLEVKKIRKNFILIDLICHGVPSYLLWSKYLATKKNISDVQFRNKKFGWRIKAITTDGKILEKERKSLFYDFFLIGNIYNETCYECKYRVTSCADIRIGDFWGPKFKNNKNGVSMVLAITELGKEVIVKMKKLEYGKFNEEDILNYFYYQQTRNFKPPFNRKKILEDLKKDNLTLSQISDKYCKAYKKEEKQKKIIIRIYNILKSLYKKLKKREEFYE